MPRVATPKEPQQVNQEVQDEMLLQAERLESAARKLKKQAKRLRDAYKQPEPPKAA